MIDELHDVITASDIEVSLKLAAFCPADVAATVRRSYRETSLRLSERRDIRASKRISSRVSSCASSSVRRSSEVSLHIRGVAPPHRGSSVVSLGSVTGEGSGSYKRRSVPLSGQLSGESRITEEEDSDGDGAAQGAGGSVLAAAGATPPGPAKGAEGGGHGHGHGHGRLHLLCVELIETERRYHRDLSLIVHTFIRRLREAAPNLIQALVANAEQLLYLHDGLLERMAALGKEHKGARLAEALGSELLAVSPYLVMYVSYCANFMSGMDMLQTAARTDRVLMKVVSQAENEITRRNQIEGIGSTGHVSIYAFLIKPVQRLCQYPLLYKEIVKALPAEAPPSSPSAAEAQRAADEAVRTAREGSRGRQGARLRPMGGAAAPVPKGASSRAKAEYVLAVLEEVAQDVNNKVRAKEDGESIIQRLLKGGHGKPHAVAMAVLGPAAALVMEMVVEVEADGHGNIRGLSDASAPEKRTISFAPWISFGGKGRASNQRKHLLGKLFLFRDRVLVAKTDGGAGGGGGGSGDGASDAFTMLVCWPLEEVEFSTKPVAAAKPSKAGAERSHFAEVTMRFARGTESIECGCMKAEADRASGEIRTLQQELKRLKLRRDRSKLLRESSEGTTASSADC